MLLYSCLRRPVVDWEVNAGRRSAARIAGRGSGIAACGCWCALSCNRWPWTCRVVARSIVLYGLHVAVVDALVISQTVQGTVDTLADVADGLLCGSHMYVLDVSLQPSQWAQILVTRVATEVLATDSSRARGRTIVIVVVVSKPPRGWGCRSHWLQTAQS